MLLKFLPSERCRIDRFFANHTSSVDRSESSPAGSQKENRGRHEKNKTKKLILINLAGGGDIHGTVVRDVQAGDVRDLGNATLQDL